MHHTVYSAVHCIKCTVQYIVRCTVYSTPHCTLGSAQCRVYCKVYTALYSVQYSAQCRVYCKVCTALYSVLGSAQCTVYCKVYTALYSVLTVYSVQPAKGFSPPAIQPGIRDDYQWSGSSSLAARASSLAVLQPLLDWDLVVCTGGT